MLRLASSTYGLLTKALPGEPDSGCMLHGHDLEPCTHRKFPRLWSPAQTDSFDWRAVSVSAVPPVRATKAQAVIRLEGAGAGTAWLNSVLLKEPPRAA